MMRPFPRCGQGERGWRKSAERVDRRRWNEIADELQQMLIGAHERAALELRERDVLGRVRGL
jgi:hypothetical protein